jgi:hypothetical protein
MGRRPLGDRPMTSTERWRRWYDKQLRLTAPVEGESVEMSALRRQLKGARTRIRNLTKEKGQ